MKITSLQPHKKKRQGQFCFEVELDDGTSRVIEAETLANHHLHAGDELTVSQWGEVCIYDDRRMCLRKAINLLSIRLRSRYELEERLLRDGFHEVVVDQAMTQLEDGRYLNDADFAVKFARSRMQKKILGEKALRSELYKKGIPEAIITKTIPMVLGERDEKAVALKAARKKNKLLREADPAKRMRKLTAFLVQRGFSGDLAYQVSREILKTEETGSDL